jgi:uncharacterized repeat protein (TIGR02543 family)
MFMAVGAAGTLLTSSDGVSWTIRTSGTTNYINGVSYGNGTYVAVGNSGTIVTSSDGVNWTSRTSGTTNPLSGVSYGTNTYVAVGDGGTIMTSSDGVNWAIRMSGTTKSVYSVTYGNGTYVAVGAQEAIVTSSDGAFWTSRMSGNTVQLNSVTYGNGTYVAVGFTGSILNSSDGVNWINCTSGTTNILNGVSYGIGTYVAVGDSGTIVTSSNGVNWTSRTSGTTVQLNSVNYGNGTYVVVGDEGTILTSSNGVNWTSRTSGTTNPLRGVSYGTNTYVVVGDAGTILTSSDGASWVSRTSGTSKYFLEVNYVNGTYVAVGSLGMILTSSDGASWTNRTSGTFNDLYGVSYGNGTYVAVGDLGTILQSESVNPTYTITYNGNGSTGGNVPTDSNSYAENATVTVLGNTGSLVKTGKTFADWNTAADGSGTSYAAGATFTMGMANLTLYAQWTTDPTYTVTYNGNGSTGGTVPTDSSAYVQNASVTVLGNTGSLVKTGNTFTGWNTEADGSGTSYAAGTTFSMGMANLTLYAQWTTDPTYTVTYNGNGSMGGIVPTDSSAYVQNASVTVLGNTGSLVKTGNTFAGWNTAANGSGTSYAAGATFSIWAANVTLYAKWTAIPPVSYTVNFDPDGGSAVASVTGVSTGATISAPTAPTKNGYTFEGWYKEANHTTPWNFGTDTVTGNITLYAKWTAIPPVTYTVSFDSDGGSAVASVTGVSTGATISAPTAPTKNGYTFEGWYKEANHATPWDFGTDTVTGNITLYAKWTAIPPVTYTVSFDPDGGSAVASVTGLSAGATISTPVVPTKSGYVFEGWYKEAVHVTPWDFGTYTVTGNITLYAKWMVASEGGSGEGSGDSGSGGSNGSPGSPASPGDNKVIAEDGELSLPAGRTGEVQLGDEITIDIPVGATDKDLKLTIEKVLDTQSLLTNKEMLVSEVFEVLKNFPDNFNKPVKLTFTFDPTKLSDVQKPSIFYYDEEKKEWVEVGGIVNGNQIAVEVDHFTKYTVIAVSQTSEVELNFSDIFGHWAEESIKQAVSIGFVNGYADGAFKPGKTVSRTEFTVMLMNALKPQREGATLTFTDTAKIGAWAQKAVSQAIQAGIIKGYEDGTFRPDAAITRAEMAAMIANALKLSIESDSTTSFADDKNIPSWAKGAVAAIKKLDLIEGTGANQFNPNTQATRAEAVTVLLKMLAQKSK